MRTIASTDIDTDADLGVLVGALILGYNSILQKKLPLMGIVAAFSLYLLSCPKGKSGMQ
jgi:hypothetical protein